MKAAPSGNPELDALAAAAAGADKGTLVDPVGAVPGAGDGPAPGGPAVDPAKEWAQLPALFGVIVSDAMPELRQVYTEEACMRWGKGMVPLAEKYGWNVEDILAWLGPWVGAAIVSLPLALPTIRAVRARVGEKKPDGEAPAQPAKPSNVVAMPATGGDPDFRDPTQTNKPPRPTSTPGDS